MFEGFDLSMIDTGEATLRVRHGGSGPPDVISYRLSLSEGGKQKMFWFNDVTAPAFLCPYERDCASVR